MSLKGKSLAILTPMYGGMCANNYFNSSITLKELLLKHEVPHAFISTSNESLVTRARNRLADRYLKNTELTHAAYVDADIGYDPHDMLKLLDLDFDIAGMPCSRKEIRWDRLQRMFQKNHKSYSAEDISRAAGAFVFNAEPFQGQRQMNLGEPQEMRHVGTGLLMVRRNVFEKYEEEYPDRWYETGNADPQDLAGPIHEFFRSGVNTETRQYESEDYIFCNDCKAMGFKVWLCPWMTTTHMGTYTFVADMPASAKLTGEI